MSDTSASLLQRLRERPDQPSWERFRQLYEPLIRHWLRRLPMQPLQPSDVDDLTQEVFAKVVQEMPQFEYDRQKGPFRGWLRMLLVNRLREFWRKHESAEGGSSFREWLDQQADPNS